MVSMFLKLGIDLNEFDKDGLNAFQSAIMNDHVDVAKLLLENGANINVKTKEAEHESSPLQLAAKYGMLNSLKFLIENHANPFSVDINGETALKIVNEDNEFH